MEMMDVDWTDTRETASDHAGWRQLVARCSAWNGGTVSKSH